MATSLSSLRIEATLDAAGYVAGGNAKAATDAKMVQSGQQLAGTLDATDRKLSTTGTSAERLARSLNPAYAETQKLETGMRTLQRALDSGSISAERHTQLVTLLNQRYGAATPAINDNTKAVGHLAEAHTKLSTQGMEAFHVLRSVAEQAAIGAPPMQILAQHMGQLSYAASGPGGLSGALGQVGTLLRGFVTPVTATVAGLAAVAGGFALIVSRAIEAQSQIRGFDVLLRGVGATSLGTGAGLGAAARSLRDVGLTPQEGGAAITTAIRAGINPAAAAGIVRTGANLEPSLGANATQTLTSALTGGVEASIKFAQSINAVSAGEIASYREMARAGQSLQAINDIFAKISNQATNLHRDSLSPLGKKLEDLHVSTGALLDTLAKSAVIQGAVDTLTKFVDGLDRLANLNPPAWLTALIGSALGPTGAVAGYVTGRALNAQYGQAGAASAAGEYGVGQRSAASAGVSQGNAFDPRGLPLSTPDLQRLAAVLDAAVKHLPGGYAAIATSTIADRASGTQNHPEGKAVDIKLVGPEGPLANKGADTTGLYSQLAAFAYLENQRMFPGTSLAWGGRFATVPGGNVPDLMHFDTGADRGHLAPPLAELAARYAGSTATATASATNPPQTGGVLRPDTAATASTEAVDKIIAERTREVQIMNKVGLAYDQAQAKIDAANITEEKHLTGSEAARLEQGLVALAYDKVAAAVDKTVQATRLEISGNRDIAAGYAESAAAGLKAEQVAQATREIYQTLGTTTGQTAKALIGLRTAQLEANQAQQVAIEINKGINQRTDQSAVARLQIGLGGKTSEEIAAATATLQEQQKLRNQGVSLTSDIAKSDLASVDANNKANIALAESNRQWSRIDDAIRSAAGTIDSTLVSAIEGAFDKSKVTDWGATIKSVLSQISSQLLSSLVIKPIIGSALSSLGLTNAASSFGSIKDVFGGVGKLFGDSSSSGGGDFFSSIGDLFGGSSASGLSSGLTGAESLAGFDTLGGTIGMGAADVGGGAAAGLFGSLGSALGPIGAVAAIGIPLISGLFSSKPKTKENFGYGSLNAATGAISSTFQSTGNAQNDRTSKQFLSGLSQFITGLNATLPSGVSLSPSGVAVATGTKSGTVATLTQDGLDSMFGNTPEGALSGVELELVKRMQGMSATMKTVVDQLSDAAQIQSALTFAQAYDNPKKSVDSLFSSLPGEAANKVGAYADALTNLNTTFDQLTKNAQQYNLATEPLAKARADATSRLITDFAKDIASQDLAITNPIMAQVKAINDNARAQLTDAKAIGADITGVNQLTADSLKKLWTDATTGITDLITSLKTGSLSGRSAASQAAASNDNYLRELGLVKGGNLGELGNLTSAANTTISSYQSTYGNAPITAKLRRTLIGDLDSVLSARSFADGGSASPGWNRVGERGAEWLYMPSGGTVLPSGTSPGGENLAPLLRQLIAIAREHGMISERGFGQVVAQGNRAPLTDVIRTKVA